MSTTRYLITGGAGFIGSHLSEELLHRGGRVTIIDDLLHGYGGGYLPPILGCKSRPSGPVPEAPFRAGQTVVIQPNVVTRDGKAGVQTGEMVVITESGVERLHTVPRGFHII